MGSGRLESSGRVRISAGIVRGFFYDMRILLSMFLLESPLPGQESVADNPTADAVGCPLVATAWMGGFVFQKPRDSHSTEIVEEALSLDKTPMLTAVQPEHDSTVTSFCEEKALLI
jgi:hypothetical protein